MTFPDSNARGHRLRHNSQRKRLARKLTALRQEVWQIMHEPLAEQHCWYTILRFAVIAAGFGFWSFLPAKKPIG